MSRRVRVYAWSGVYLESICILGLIGAWVGFCMVRLGLGDVTGLLIPIPSNRQ